MDSLVYFFAGGCHSGFGPTYLKLFADDLSRLDDIVRRRAPVARGDRLFRVGDPMTSVFVARDGAFKAVNAHEEGEERVQGFHLAGDLIGLDALGTGAHRCEAIGLTDFNVCEIPFDALTSIAIRLPSPHKRLLKVVGQCADRDLDHVEILVRRQASERIALFVRNRRSQSARPIDASR